MKLASNAAQRCASIGNVDRLRRPLRAMAGLALGLMLLAGDPAFAQTTSTAPTPTAESAAIRKALDAKFPGMEIRQVNKTPVLGLYEVVLPDQIIYTDAKVNYVFVGSIFEANSKTNLTEERSRLLNRVAFDSLPLNLAMRKVKGTGERRLAVFSDADCPFCAKLEDELKSVDNVTIYTFLFPIAELHPDATRKSKQIWCSPDPQKAWDEFFATKKLPDNKGDCPTPIADLHALGEKLRVTATPTLVFADGTVVPGAIPAARLEAQLQTAQTEIGKAAAAKK